VLALRDGAEAVAVDQVVASHHLVQVRYRPGSRLPLDRAAHGRALLAEGAAAGHVVRDGEPEAGVKGVAAPIFGGSGPVASIGLVAPTHRFPPEADVVAAVRAAARLVTTAMGETQPTDAADEGDDHAVLPARG
jgi:DNA-binding IclR family transcriptional regulator